MKQIILLLISLLFLLLSSYSQVLDNSEGNLFSDKKFFNTKFIQQNKIKSIQAIIASKRNLKPIQQLGLFELYDFNSQGLIIRYAESHHITKGSKDTTVVIYERNNKNQITTLHKTDANGFFAYHYTYNSIGDVVKQVYLREQNLKGKRTDFSNGKDYVILDESFTYKHLDNETIQTFFNTNGKPYKELSTKYDTYKNRIETSEKYIVTNRRHTITYEFDEKHQLINKRDKPVFSGGKAILYHYEYDDIGNVQKELFYRNKQLVTTTEYLYQKESMLLGARLIKDEATGTIKIIKYEYLFY